MSRDQDRQATSGFELEQFEKNRYFQGKLMTARDMLADQRYHADRLETLARGALGEGIVSGLGISSFEDHGDEIEVTVEPGLAVDARGRPVVVRNPTTQRLTKPDGSEVYLYLRHDTERKDPVPVPGEAPTDGEESEESRVIEVFTVEKRETPPEEYDDLSSVTLPDFDTTDASPRELADEIASRYHDDYRTDLESGTDDAVFLGGYALGTEGEWRPIETERRPLVYDTDMLFDLLVTHVTDTDNPHNTRIGQPTEYIESELGEIEQFQMRLREFRREIDALNEKLDTHTDYVTHKSLESAVRFFDETATTFEEFGEISRAALDVVDAVRDGLAEDVADSGERYERFVDGLVGDLRHLASTLEGQATEESYRAFADAVDELDAAVGEEGSVVETATRLDRVGEAAESLEPRFDVVPGGGS